jgi:hypothetical protein
MIEETALPTDSDGSEPFQVFIKKIGNLKQLVDLMVHQIERIQEPAAEFDAAFIRNPLNADDLRNPVQSIVGMVRTWLTLHPLLWDWMLVMMVSFAEAYLEDALTLLVAHKPELLRGKRTKRLGRATELALEVSDLSYPSEEQWRDLVKTIHRNLAKDILSGKPEDWIPRLTKLGVNYHDEKNLREKMTTIWNRRHEIVHSPHSEQAYGRSRDTFQEAIGVIDGFVEPIDTFLMGFLKTTAHPKDSSAPPIQ